MPKNIKHTALNGALLNRIDNINDAEYDPYKALKKSSIDTDELFDESDYKDNTESDNGKQLTIAIVVTVIIAIVVIAVYALH